MFELGVMEFIEKAIECRQVCAISISDSKVVPQNFFVSQGDSAKSRQIVAKAPKEWLNGSAL